jgi:hypothetical protein
LHLQNSGGEMEKADAALLTVLLLPPEKFNNMFSYFWQTCIGLLAYPDAASAPPDAQFLLLPSFKFHTASVVNLALIHASHPDVPIPQTSSSPLTGALAATLALQKVHLDACGGRGLSFEFEVQNEDQLKLQQLLRLEVQHLRQERNSSSDETLEMLQQHQPQVVLSECDELEDIG